MDFNNFHFYQPKAGACSGGLASTPCTLTYYSPGGIPGGPSFSVKNAPLAYTISPYSLIPIAFSVDLMNTDQAQRTIVLDGSSLVFFFDIPGGSASSFKSHVYGISSVDISTGAVTCTGNTGTPPYSTCVDTAGGIVLPYGVTKTIFFTFQPTSPLTSSLLVAGSFYLHGKMGAGCTSLTDPLCTSPIGQNEPLVVIYVTS
jgi:hypothetical protein